MKPDCIHCSRHLRLVADDGLNYWWRCEAGCAEGIDTGIPSSSSIESFQRDVLHRGRLDMSRLLRPLPAEYVSGARVYMPQLLYHFIECTWGACYNHLYLYCIAPYLDASEVVDYILRTPVVRSSKGDTRPGSTGAQIYGELDERLRRVSSPKIAEYLRRTFDDQEAPGPNGVNA